MIAQLTEQSNTQQSNCQPLGELPKEAVAAITTVLRHLLADAFVLYLKTKNFHWHMRGPHFRDYHLLLDEQAEQIFGMTDDIAERARKLGGPALRSIGDIVRHQRLADHDEADISAVEMLSALRDDNRALTGFLCEAHDICDTHKDVATASLIENWIDQSQRRNWFLSEAVQ